jgi:hypothetical protein
MSLQTSNLVTERFLDKKYDDAIGFFRYLIFYKTMTKIIILITVRSLKKLCDLALCVNLLYIFHYHFIN